MIWTEEKDERTQEARGKYYRAKMRNKKAGSTKLTGMYQHPGSD